MSTSLGRLCIVDDEEPLMSALCDRLTEQGYEAEGFTSAKAALEALREKDFDVLLTDLMMPLMGGLALLRAALEIDPHLVGIIMTGYGTVQAAVDAMKFGAFDFVLKPFKLNVLVPILTRAMQLRRLHLENVHLRETVAIYELSRAIAFTLDLNTILNKVVDAAAQQSEADQVSILLPTPSGEELYVGAVCGPGLEHLLGERVSMQQGTEGWVARHSEPLVRDASIWVPMLSGGKLQGVLHIDGQQRRRPFTLGEVKALNILVSIAAPALENARLYARLREAEERYRSIFENAVEGIFQLAPDGRYRVANPALARILGYASPEELILGGDGNPLAIGIEPDRRAQLQRLLETEGQARGFEFQASRQDGQTIWVSETVQAVRGVDDGAVLYYEGTLEDITERKEAESQRENALEALAGERRLLRTLIDALPDHVYVKDTEGRMILVNAGLARAFGLRSPDEAIGKTDFELVLADLAAQYREVELEVMRLGRPVALEEPFLTATGEKRLMSTIKVPMRDTHGDVVGLVGMSRDITEHKRLEEQFLQAQKMETVGRLAGGVAHDFNNLLTAIGGYASLVKRALPPGDVAHADIDEVIRASERAAGLTRQLLAFSRRQIIEQQVVDLNRLIVEMDKMLRRLISEDVDLVTVPGRDLGAVKADPGQIEQVLANLAVNARDAMSGGGTLTVETANVTLDADYARLHVGVAAGEYVMLAISDTGAGMSDEVKAHVFEPFFTTKEKGKGTGLGLATVYGIVRQHGGNIWVYSEPGRGTTFKIYLPRVDATPAEGKLRPTEATWLPRGTETILVVEDEPMVRNIAVQGLAELGYTVLEAANGGEALQVVQNHAGKIDLLLTDVVMPKMGGKELAVRLKDICPDLPVLYTSGYTDNAIVHQGVLDEGVAFLQKPFTTVALARKVHEVLHGKTSG